MTPCSPSTRTMMRISWTFRCWAMTSSCTWRAWSSSAVSRSVSIRLEKRANQNLSYSPWHSFFSSCADERVLQSGLCISGQTINAARLRLQHVELPEMTQIIVNIGSVDIMRGKPLVQIEHDFRQLIKEMHNRRFIPVLTTLAPLANYRHDKQTCDKVLRFNKFIRTEGRHLTVIDIHSCLVNESGVVRFDCFQKWVII